MSDPKLEFSPQHHRRADTRYRELVSQIKKRRMEKGLSQADVAHAIGIAPGTVRSCEKLNNVTLTVTLLEILDALDLEISVYPKEVKRGQRNS